MGLTATALHRLLAARHAKDVYVAECKNGPTVSSRSLRILDGWAMARSWTHLKFTGYEIKVDRSDFLNDEKWIDYLPLCHELYFVAPAGLIDPWEVPEQAGLLLSSKNGTRLFCKKKAPFRNIEPPFDLLVYVLMSRSEIKADWGASGPGDVRAYWLEWLEQKEEDRRLGHLVALKIRETVDSYRAAAHEATRRVELYQHLEKRLRELDLDPERTSATWQIDRKLDELTGKIPAHLSRTVQNLARELESLHDTLTRLGAN